MRSKLLEIIIKMSKIALQLQHVKDMQTLNPFLLGENETVNGQKKYLIN